MEFSNFDAEIKKKVFFKPQFSSEVKYSSIIAPQFTNETNISYMSGHQFMTYNIDDQSFTMAHRPFKSFSSNDLNEQQFINVRFGEQQKQRINQTFYVVKSIINEQQVYYLGRRGVSLNRQTENKILCKGVSRAQKHKKKLFSNSNFKKQLKKIKGQKQVPKGVLSFGNQFIVNPQLNVVAFRVVKQVQQKRTVTFKEETDQQDKSEQLRRLRNKNSIQLESQKDQQNQNMNDSFSSSFGAVKQQIKSQQKSGLLIYSLQKNESVFWNYKDNILQLIALNNNRYILFTQHQLLLVQFQLHANYQHFSQETKQYQQRTSIQVKIVDLYQLPFSQKTQHDNYNKIKNPQHFSSSNKDKKGHSNSVVFQNLGKQLWLKKDRRSVLKDNRVSLKQTLIQQFQKAKQQIKGQKSWKQTKKVIQIFRLCQGISDYLLLLHCNQKMILNFQELQSESKQYSLSVLNVQDGSFCQMQHQEQICNNQSLLNGSLAAYINEVQNTQLIQKNIMSYVKQINGITTRNNLILIWQKNQCAIHQIAFKVHVKTAQMLDPSDPVNLKTQKTINFQRTLILEYRNKISMQIDSNLIKNVIISPCCRHFLISVGSSRQTRLSEVNSTERQLKQQTLDHVDQNYDISQYLLFQYDLFIQLWTNDPNIYLKNIPNVYQKRRVLNIVPFKTKNQILVQSGNKIHELHKYILDGALSFDVHPYGFFLAVSFGFTAKIYSLQHATINLIYTHNAQAIKKICYNPNGSDLVIMSSKHVKVLDCYSFAIKHIIAQKSANCSFNYLSFSAEGSKMYCVYDNIFVNIHSTDSYEKCGSIKPSQNSILHSTDKIVSICSSEKNNFFVSLLQNGSLYLRWSEHVVSIKREQIYAYEDQQKIACIHYEDKAKILFCGMKNGIVRAHLWPIPSQSYNFNTFSQFKFGYSQITVLQTSFLSNTLYTGDVNGNVGVVSYIIEKQRKITGQIRLDNFLITNIHNTFLSNYKAQALSVQKCYKFSLTSSSISLNECPQKLKLQYKLNQIITRMNEQMKKFKGLMKDRLIQKQGLARNKINFNKLYNQVNQKLSQITKIIKQLKEKQSIQKNNQIQQYEQTFKKIIDQQNQLTKERGLQLSKNIMAKSFLKSMHQRQIQKFMEEAQKQEGVTPNSGHKAIQLLLKTQSLVPYDQVDLLPHWITQSKKQYLTQLQKQLQKQQQKCFQLKKTCTYLEGSKSKLSMAKIKEETIQFRIDIELKQMNNKLDFQKSVYGELSKEVREAEEKIQKLQQKVVQRNPHFSKSTQGQSGDDGCLYKIWVKDRYNQEITLLGNHLCDLNQIIQKKRTDIIDIVTWKNKIKETCKSQQQHRIQLKNYLSQLKKQVLSLKGSIQNQYCGAYKYDIFKKGFKIQKSKIKKTKPEENNVDLQVLLHNSRLASQHNKFIKTSKLKKRDPQIQSNKKYSQVSTFNTAFASTSSGFCQNSEIRLHDLPFKMNLIQTQNFKQFQNSESFVEISQQQKTKQSKLNFLNTLREGVSKIEGQHYQFSQASFTNRLMNQLSRKKESSKLKCNMNMSESKQKKCIPFSATSSPQLKKINYCTNLLQKKTKFFKNIFKIDQRKIKRINGENADLLSQFQQLKVQNVKMDQHQKLFIENLNMVKGLFDKSQNDFQPIRLNTASKNKKQMTPFQKYIADKSSKKFIKVQQLKQNKESVTSPKFYQTAVSSPNFTERTAKKRFF